MGDSQVVLLTTTSVRKGEQLSISYVDETLDLAHRMPQLRAYGFQCGCLRCTTERAVSINRSPGGDGGVGRAGAAAAEDVDDDGNPPTKRPKVDA